MYFALILSLLGGLVMTAGDIFMKKWIGSNLSLFYILGLALYIVGLNFLAQSYRFENIAIASISLIVFNIVSLAIVSWIFFKQPLTTFQIVGLIVALIAVIILELE